MGPRQTLNVIYNGVGIFFICECYQPVHADLLLEEQINESSRSCKTEASQECKKELQRIGYISEGN